MNKLIITIIFLFISIFSYSQTNSSNDGIFNIGVTYSSGTLTVSLTYDGTLPAGTTEGLPRTDEAITDLAFTLRWPSTTTLSLGSITNVGGISFIKSGAISSLNGFNFQKIISSGAGNFNSNMVQNVAYNLFTVPVTIVSGSGTVEIAPLNYQPNLPSLQIDYFNTSPSPDIYEYYPPDITQSAPLPINFTDISAIEKGKANQISWSTESEINSEYQVVERSRDGINNWVQVNKVTSVNDRNGASYDALDNNPLSLSYYRVRNVDLDGTSNQSSIVSVLRKTKEIETTLSITPNPGFNFVNASFELPEVSTDLTYQIVDALGQVIYKTASTAPEGNNIVRFDISQFPSGVYMLLINGDNLFMSEQFIKQ